MSINPDKSVKEEVAAKPDSDLEEESIPQPEAQPNAAIAPAASAASPVTAAPGAVGVAATIATEASGGGEIDDFDDWQLDPSVWQDIADEIENAGPGMFKFWSMTCLLLILVAEKQCMQAAAFKLVHAN